MHGADQLLNLLDSKIRSHVLSHPFRLRRLTTSRHLVGMNPSYICLACRRSLSRNRLQKVIQWRPKATFISLSNEPSNTADDKSREDLLNLGNVDDAEKKRFAGARALQERRRQAPRQPSPYNDGDLLEALFEESLKEPSTEKPPPTISVEPYIHADTLRQMLAKKDGSVAEAWTFFVEHFGPEAWKEGKIDERTVPKRLHSSNNLLVRKLIAAKRMDPVSLELPTIAEFTKIYSQLGMLRCSSWSEAMLVLLESLMKLESSPAEDPVHKRHLISDIVGAWNVVFRLVGKTQDFPSKDAPHDWSHIPSVSISHSSNLHQRFGSRGLFAQFAPMFPPRSQISIPVVAVASFALLARDSMTDDMSIRDAMPLLSSLGTAISIAGFNVDSVATEESVPSLVNKFLKQTASQTKELASNMRSALGAAEAESSSISVSRPSSKFRSILNTSLSPSNRTDIASITKRLWDAMKRQDTPQVDSLWADAQQFQVVNERPNTRVDGVINPVRRSARGTLTADLCNYFVMIYMALHQPSRAIEVWNFMVRNGLPPTLKTWDSMMSGCKACRDSRALEDVWMRMRQLGVQPDVVCWTTRISGLIECNKLDKGIHALDEMGRLWVAANKGGFEGSRKQNKASKKKVVAVEGALGAVKPTIETINAALAGLLRRHQTEAAHRILAWAAKLDIKPNVITYNTLLTPLIRGGQSKHAMAILKQMQSEGIQADVATFTAILEETLLYSDELASAELKTITENVFSEMEAAGVKANVQTYGSMINQLLQGESGDLRVVNAVMERMATQGVQPNTHIYTALVTHYFGRDPADLDAVRNLIEISKLEVGSVDHIFWDRVIEGYSRAGETTAAMRVLGELESRGNKCSWTAKQVLLSSLVQNDEWAIAKSFVKNVKEDSGGPKPAHKMKGQDGQKRFWKLAAELELL